jgi:predicted amidohydrolase YtcJ
MNSFRYLYPVFIILLFSCKPKIAADKIYFNASVWTGDSSNPSATCVAIKGNQIVYVGNDPGRVEGEKIDLQNQMIIPGLRDNHTHFLLGGYALASVQLKNSKSKQEFIHTLAEYCRVNPGSNWIKGGDWDHEAWGGDLPTRQWIDSITGDHPVFLTRYDGHMALANTKALTLANINRNTMDPPGGKIIRDSKGEPTGVLKDEALALIDSRIPEPTDAELDSYMARASKNAVEHGVTAVDDVSYYGGWKELATYQRANKNKSMLCRIYSFVPLRDWKKMEDYVKSNGKGDGMLIWGGLKGFVDGSLGSTTAWFYKPFLDDPSSSGLTVTDTSLLKEWVINADKAGLHVTVHAIGDRANDYILSVFDEAEKANPGKDHRFRVEHAQHPSSTAFAEFAKLKVIPSMQPYHLVDDGNFAYKRLEEDRLRRTYAFRSMLDAGAKLTFGSDWTVAPLDPILGIHAAVNRETADGKNSNGWFPEQKISVEEALHCYTSNNAYAAFVEDKLGMIKTGMLADLTVLDRNILKIDPKTIKDSKVTRTIVDGKEVFNASH